MRRNSFPPQTDFDAQCRTKNNNFAHLIKFTITWGEIRHLIEQQQLGNMHAIIIYFLQN